MTFTRKKKLSIMIIIENFEWLDCHQEERCIYAIGRKTADHMIVGIFNFSDKEQKDYKLTIKGHHTRRTLLHTEWEQYGGTMKKRKENIHLKKKEKTVSLRSHFQDTVEFY